MSVTRQRRVTQSPEFSQAVFRVVFVGALVVHFSFGPIEAVLSVEAVDLVIKITTVYFIVSLGWACSVLWSPGAWPLRRVAAFTLDLAVIAWLSGIVGEIGPAFYPLYLWVIVGNGMRYGLAYLFGALTVGLAGFITVALTHPYWQAHPTIAGTLLTGLVVLPLFYAGLISQLRMANCRLSEQVKKSMYDAMHDHLTGLPNRAFFTQRLNESLEHSSAQSGRFGLLFVDLNEFKPVNDQFGHEAGDELLRRVANRLRHSVRTDDFVARLGGDEFTVLLAAVEDRAAVQMVANNIARALAQPIQLSGRTITISASIGVSLYPDDGNTSLQLIRRADQAMYEAKQGRITSRRYDTVNCSG